MFSRILSRLFFFGANSNIHGLRYISDRNRSWISRLFWITALCLCGWGLLMILFGTLKTFNQDTLSFTLDTNRLLWNTAFPSITVCEKFHYLRVLRKLNKFYPDLMQSMDYDQKKFFAEISFTETNCNLCKTGCGPDNNCPINFRELAEKVREPCSELIHGCSWQDKELDCCKYFLPIDSEFGLCYSFNTLQSRLSGTVPLFKSNRTTGPGYLSFYVYKRLLVYIHGSDDVPWVKSDLDMRFDVNDNIDFIFEMIEMSNDQQVKEIDLDARKCRYPQEVLKNYFEKPYKLYGYSTCMITCETELMFKQCECVHHLRDNTFTDITCNFTGLICLSLFAEDKNKFGTDQVEKHCQHCIPSCEEIQLTKIHYNTYETDDDYSRVDIKMANLPNIRYKRNVIHSNLDLVVSIGGLAGLFFGASLLSIVEAIYLIFFRAT
ncbi:sodium channel protein Nach-like isoform X2 [Arctopsyche grandis]